MRQHGDDHAHRDELVRRRALVPDGPVDAEQPGVDALPVDDSNACLRHRG